MDGILVIDKPRGPTSHDVVDSVRQALNMQKIGHTGTLDPEATGVLPLVLGSATKLARYLSGGDKTYQATLHLGVSTRTLDAEGDVTQTREVRCTVAQLEATLAQFSGALTQMPPMYSAKKVNGKKLYQLARQGLEVERQAKQVHVRAIRLVEAQLPKVLFDVTCSAGTYVRALAHDIGEALQCGGHLSALRRTAAGPFHLEQAVPLSAVVGDPATAKASVLPVSQALQALPHLCIPPNMVRLIVSGYQLSVADLRRLDAPTFTADDALALAEDNGRVIAVARAVLSSEDLSGARRDRRALKTERVLSGA